MTRKFKFELMLSEDGENIIWKNGINYEIKYITIKIWKQIAPSTEFIEPPIFDNTTVNRWEVNGNDLIGSDPNFTYDSRYPFINKTDQSTWVYSKDVEINSTDFDGTGYKIEVFIDDNEAIPNTTTKLIYKDNMIIETTPALPFNTIDTDIFDEESEEKWIVNGSTQDNYYGSKLYPINITPINFTTNNPGIITINGLFYPGEWHLDVDEYDETIIYGRHWVKNTQPPVEIFKNELRDTSDIVQYGSKFGLQQIRLEVSDGQEWPYKIDDEDQSFPLEITVSYVDSNTFIEYPLSSTSIEVVKTLTIHPLSGQLITFILDAPDNDLVVLNETNEFNILWRSPRYPTKFELLKDINGNNITLKYQEIEHIGNQYIGTFRINTNTFGPDILYEGYDFELILVDKYGIFFDKQTNINKINFTRNITNDIELRLNGELVDTPTYSYNMDEFNNNIGRRSVLLCRLFDKITEYINKDSEVTIANASIAINRTGEVNEKFILTSDTLGKLMYIGNVDATYKDDLINQLPVGDLLTYDNDKFKLLYIDAYKATALIISEINNNPANVEVEITSNDYTTLYEKVDNNQYVEYPIQSEISDNNYFYYDFSGMSGGYLTKSLDTENRSSDYFRYITTRTAYLTNLKFSVAQFQHNDLYPWYNVNINYRRNASPDLEIIYSDKKVPTQSSIVSTNMFWDKEEDKIYKNIGGLKQYADMLPIPAGKQIYIGYRNVSQILFNNPNMTNIDPIPLYDNKNWQYALDNPSNYIEEFHDSIYFQPLPTKDDTGKVGYSEIIDITSFTMYGNDGIPVYHNPRVAGRLVFPEYEDTNNFTSNTADWTSINASSNCYIIVDNDMNKSYKIDEQGRFEIPTISLDNVNDTVFTFKQDGSNQDNQIIIPSKNLFDRIYTINPIKFNFYDEFNKPISERYYGREYDADGWINPFVKMGWSIVNNAPGPIIKCRLYGYDPTDSTNLLLGELNEPTFIINNDNIQDYTYNNADGYWYFRIVDTNSFNVGANSNFYIEYKGHKPYYVTTFVTSNSTTNIGDVYLNKEYTYIDTVDRYTEVDITNNPSETLFVLDNTSDAYIYDRMKLGDNPYIRTLKYQTDASGVMEDRWGYFTSTDPQLSFDIYNEDMNTINDDGIGFIDIEWFIDSPHAPIKSISFQNRTQLINDYQNVSHSIHVLSRNVKVKPGINSIPVSIKFDLSKVEGI